jgi:CspA family cold shock protein
VFHEKFLENFRETSSKNRVQSNFGNWSYFPVFTGMPSRGYWYEMKGEYWNMEARLTGTVKWFSLAEGVGLIDPDNHTQQDVLVERSALVDRRSLEKGERVVFDLRTTARGWEAAGVMVLGKLDGLVAD